MRLILVAALAASVSALVVDQLRRSAEEREAAEVIASILLNARHDEEIKALKKLINPDPSIVRTQMNADYLAEHLNQRRTGVLDEIKAGKRCWYCKERHPWSSCRSNPANAGKVSR